jgi:hypothetical protein
LFYVVDPTAIPSTLYRYGEDSIDFLSASGIGFGIASVIRVEEGFRPAARGEPEMTLANARMSDAARC